MGMVRKILTNEPLKDVTMERVDSLRNLKSHYIKIVDESILFFFRISFSKFSLEALYISWV